MKALRALLLVLALSVCAYADGNMPNDVASTPPASTSVGNMPNGLAGDMDNGASATTETSITEMALSLLESVLAVFS